MSAYRFYLLDRAGRIAAPAVDGQFGDDEAACAFSHELLSAHPEQHSAQVWQGQRLVHCATREREAS